MENIAVFLNDKEEIVDFLDVKFIYQYEKKDNKWIINKEIIVNFDDVNTLDEIRYMFGAIIKELVECKIVVVKKALGIGYSMFYGEDFSIWECNGRPEEILDLVIGKELEHEEDEVKARLDKKMLEISEVDDNKYYLDLIKLQREKPEVSSKMALLPFLDKNKFEELKVHCCHVPPWLENHSKKNYLTIKVQKCLDGNIDITLTR